MRRFSTALAFCLIICGAAFTGAITTHDAAQEHDRAERDAVAVHARQLLKEGRRVFRFDTFGDEVFWGDALTLHQAIAGQALGGVGPGVSPATALAIDLKVDADALPASLQDAIRRGQVNLNDPATTWPYCG